MAASERELGLEARRSRRGDIPPSDCGAVAGIQGVHGCAFSTEFRLFLRHRAQGVSGCGHEGSKVDADCEVRPLRSTVSEVSMGFRNDCSEWLTHGGQVRAAPVVAGKVEP